MLTYFTAMYRSNAKFGVLLVALLFALQSAGAVLKTRTNGIATLAAQSTTSTIPTVDPTKSFIVFTVHTASNRPGQFQVSGEILNPTTVSFRRFDPAGPPVLISFTVFEFASGVTVQRGWQNNLPPAGANVTINPVNLSKSFVITSMYKDGGQYGSDDGITADLTSTTNLYIDRQPGGANIQGIHWQVIEYDSCSVQKITGSLNAGAEVQNFTLPTNVNEYKSLIVGSHQVTGNVNAADLPCTELVNNSTVSLSRTSTVARMDYVGYVVEFFDSTKVFHGAIRMTATENVVSTTIPAVNFTSSGAISPSNFNRAASNCQVTDDHVGFGWLSPVLINSTTVTAFRPSTGFAALIPFQIVDFSNTPTAAYSRPEPGASTPRNSGLCIAALPVDLASFTGKPVDRSTLLEWTTLTESNNDYFLIEHSTDGIEYASIGTVEGGLNSSTPLNYTFVHEQPAIGENYYRLKQFDVNGAFDYSDEIQVTFTDGGKEDQLLLSPNPATGAFTVQFPEKFSVGNKDGRLVITDLSGKTWYESVIPAASPYIRLDASKKLNLAKGVYLVAFQYAQGTDAQKLIIR